jgi:hypothetical protein
MEGSIEERSSINFIQIKTPGERGFAGLVTKFLIVGRFSS